MGLYYSAMIKEITEEALASGEAVDQFIQKNEKAYKKKYQVGELLFYLNIQELLKRLGIQSKYFDEKVAEEIKIDRASDLSEQCFRLCSSDSVECTCGKNKP